MIKVQRRGIVNSKSVIAIGFGIGKYFVFQSRISSIKISKEKNIFHFCFIKMT